MEKQFTNIDDKYIYVSIISEDNRIMNAWKIDKDEYQHLGITDQV